MAEKYIKDYDAVLLVYSILNRLGCGKVDTFDDRLKSQKVQYLAQILGISPKYQFSLYLRGPYSPSLAHDLFQLKADGIKADAEKFTPDLLEEKFNKLRTFVGKTNIRLLELVSTYHLLEKNGHSEKNITDKLKEWKEATNSEIDKTQILFKELCQI